MPYAIVLGGSSGIGEATAKILLSQAYRVTIVGRDRTRLDAARTRLGHETGIASVDANNRTAVDAFFADNGHFDHLILCQSGGKGGGPFKDLNLDDLRNGMDAKYFSQMTTAPGSASLPRGVRVDHFRVSRQCANGPPRHCRACRNKRRD